MEIPVDNLWTRAVFRRRADCPVAEPAREVRPAERSVGFDGGVAAVVHGRASRARDARGDPVGGR